MALQPFSANMKRPKERIPYLLLRKDDRLRTKLLSNFMAVALHLCRMATAAVVLAVAHPGFAAAPETNQIEFVRDIQPIFLAKCVQCHGDTTAHSGLRLDAKAAAMAGGESGLAIAPQSSQKSLLVQRIESRGDDKMPPEGEPLTQQQIALIKRWIDQGAVWPEGVDRAKRTDKYDWWSLKPLVRPPVPEMVFYETGDPANASPVDAFIRAKLNEQGLAPSAEADRRTLGRRLYFDLIGLPPTPEEIDSFVADTRADAYAQLVDKLLDSPHYGERWARHWLDVVHYGDTHGYDKDKPRPNAWPYRDYVIRAFNSDKPYGLFVEEQVAGDVLAPGTEDGITATGFIAAGPWDFIGHAEVPESKVDGMIARNLDRDDMVTNTCNTFLSITVQCARCHDHKFDPVVQLDYYRLQAVFSALDRADRPYDVEPAVSEQRSRLSQLKKELLTAKQELEKLVAQLGGQELKELDEQIAAAGKTESHPLNAQFGYHSQIETNQQVNKWVQVDLGEPRRIESLHLVGCDDDFNNIGAGFGFPVRFKVELSNDEAFENGVTTVTDQTTRDFANPGTTPVQFPLAGRVGRYVRVTATKLARRQDDFIFALAELRVFDASGQDVARGRLVQSLDSIEAPPRWQRSNLVDGYYVGVNLPAGKSAAELKSQRDDLLEKVVSETIRAAINENNGSLADVTTSLSKLSAPRTVYAGTVYSGSGAFIGTGGSGGKPRVIQILARGDVTRPVKIVDPGTFPLAPNGVGEFALPTDHAEGERRIALAKWITARDNPLTWRSIVNRVWLYHFGCGIVDSPSDFGRMGRRPSHPELLDWLAIEFRDGGQSLKRLHRLIVNSATYRQRSSAGKDDTREKIDASNTYLWRMNRRKIEAEAVRDAVLTVAGKLNRQMEGPAFQDFVVEKPDHSPHYEYQRHNPDDERIYRRSVYRFLVRSQPQPFMTTLDCADPSMNVDKRNETVTSLQALALLNNQLMLTMAKAMSERVTQNNTDLSQQVGHAFRLALSRSPTRDELEELLKYTEAHGLASLCRLLLNLNEFVFVD
jgi:hypothetical protein